MVYRLLKKKKKLYQLNELVYFERKFIKKKKKTPIILFLEHIKTVLIFFYICVSIQFKL